MTVLYEGPVTEKFKPSSHPEGSWRYPLARVEQHEWLPIDVAAWLDVVGVS